MTANFDRSIDDPGLNQDATFDKKDNEIFDESSEFHKFDDTAKDDSKNFDVKKPKDKSKILNRDESSKNGRFDGTINV